jgi:nitrate reductase delta subunit
MNTVPAAASCATTLRMLALLLSYPDASLRAHLSELRAALRDDGALDAARLASIDVLIDRLADSEGLDAEAAYVDLFDRGRRTALHLFEHVHGDSRDRGPAMIDLIKTYEEAGLTLSSHELPDHLCVVLEFASTQPPEQAESFLREIAHLLRTIHSALVERDSAYASVLAALIELAGESTEPVVLTRDAPLDETWNEPVAFGGCSTEGQSNNPNRAQPIRMVKMTHAVNSAPREQGA